MKKLSRAAIWIVGAIAALFLYGGFVHGFQQRYVPPDDTATVTDVLEWTGLPWWTVKYCRGCPVI